jgi:phosphoglycolate phosphatase-like HAD superfamily hydrolase
MRDFDSLIFDLDGTLVDSYQAITETLNYVRRGTIFEEGEQGILLNEAAQKVLVQHMIDKIESLVIRQAKSYMYVDSVEVDYNDSNKMMRIKRDESECATQPEDKFAVYFDAK